MKPYRGTLLATAMLLAALPLCSCGDADEYAKTDTITLTTSTSTVVVKREVILTVQTTTPANQYECQTDLEYRAQGAGMEGTWYTVPGSGSTRIFKLEPREVGTLSVMARGRCHDAKEDWKYTAQVDVDVTKVVDPITSIELIANPTSVEVNKPVTFTLSGTRDSECTLALKYQYSGAGLTLTTVSPAFEGQFILTPTKKGTLTVTATGWCTQNPKAAVTQTTTVDVTEEILPKVTAVTLTADKTTVTRNNPVAFTLGATKETDCTMHLEYTYVGGGFPALTTVTTTPGIFVLTPPGAVTTTTLTVIAAAYCTENPSAVVSSSAITVTVEP